MALATGEKLGPYEILELLGAGGMGEVYRARDSRLNRDVALKVSASRFNERFEQEARAVAALNHPNVCGLYDVGPDYLVMELVEGTTLADRLLKGPLPIPEAIEIARQIAAGLEAAHEKGIIHRDLKPGNVIVTADGVAKILDFGLAKSPEAATGQNGADSPTMTMRQGTEAGLILGTAGYMAPEQAAGKRVDKRADIWAFGVVLYEMLAGGRLFEGETVSHTLADVLRAPIDFAKLPKETPPSIRTLLERCLDRNVRDRLRDIGEARVALQNPAAAERVVSERKRSLLLWVLCGALALIASVFCVLWLRDEGPAQTQAHRYSLETGVPVFSPDGRWMVEARGSALRVRGIDGGDWRTLPGTDSASTPFWSPDSSAIGFFSGGRLKTISVDGVNLRNLAAAPYEGGGTWHGGASDGLIVFATNGKLRRYDFTTREERELEIQIPDGRRVNRPRFLPEGDGFVFEHGGKQIYRSSLSAVAGAAELVMDDATYVSFGRHPRNGAWHIFYVVYDVNVDGWSAWNAKIDSRTGVRAGSPVKLVTHLTSNRGSTLPESPSGYMGFQAGANGAVSWRRGSTAASIYRLRWFDRDGKVLSTFADLGRYMELALSPDETRVAVVQGEPGAEIWIYHTQRGTGVLLTTEAGRKYETLWSPDGKYVYYMLISDRNQSVVRRVAEGGGTPEVLYQIDGDPTMHIKELTPDGKYLILQSSKGIFRLSTSESGNARKLEPLIDASSGFRPVEFIRMTRDGRWLVCSGGGETYIVPYPLGGKAVNLRSALIGQPFFSADGRTAFGAGGRGGDRTMTMQPIINEPGGGIRFGERSSLFPILTPGRVGANVAAVSRDGTRILAISTDDAEALKTQVLTDWTALLPTEKKNGSQ